jgi:hypothetical protein
MMDAEGVNQPVDEPVVAAGQAETMDLDPRVSTPDDGIPVFDDEDSEEVEATLGDDSYDEAEAEPDEEH